MQVLLRRLLVLLTPASLRMAPTKASWRLFAISKKVVLLRGGVCLVTVIASAHRGERNGDPDARFTLANERTFLAWGRTSLAFVATGLALARLLGDGDDLLIELAGVALIVIGGLLALFSYRNYRRVDEAIRADAPIPRSNLPAILLATIVVAGAVAIVLSLT